jgi:CubicO group peptidase (beta-lactamase class C family)
LQETIGRSRARADRGLRGQRVAAIVAESESLRRHFDVPGASLVIVSGDSVTLSRGFGFRDAAQRLPVTPSTRFVIGSCTKPFAALSAAIGVDRRLLSLDDSPRRFLPYFHSHDPAVFAARSTTTTTSFSQRARRSRRRTTTHTRT